MKCGGKRSATPLWHNSHTHRGLTMVQPARTIRPQYPAAGPRRLVLLENPRSSPGLAKAVSAFVHYSATALHAMASLQHASRLIAFANP